MTPGQHIEQIRSLVEQMMVKHPLGPCGMLVYSDLMDDLDKVQREYNCQELNKENQDVVDN